MEAGFLVGSWADLSGRLRRLVGECEAACSPGGVLAAMLAGDGVPEDVRRSLITELHEEWCGRYGVRAWVNEILELISELDGGFANDRLDASVLESSCRRLCDLLHRYPAREGVS